MMGCVRVLAIAAVISATAPLTLNAHDWSGGYGSDRWGEGNYRLSTEDLKAFTDVRIAALKAGLQLTQEQQANWPPFEQALRDLVQLRVERIQAMQNSADQNQHSLTPFDRLSRRADAMAKRSVALKKIADTGTPLYQSLTDTQKSRFVFLADMLRWSGRGFGKEQRESGNDYDHDRNGMRSGRDDGEENRMTSPDTDEDDDDSE
jgi:hypothetical protein